MLHGWVQAVGFSNIIFVFFIGRYFVPWDALGFAQEKGSPMRFGDVWQASRIVAGQKQRPALSACRDPC
jgi:hypothetical protein